MFRVWGIFVILVLLTLLILGVRGMPFSQPPLMIFFDMKFQPKYTPQGASQFFADGRAQRMPIAGTVPYGGADYASDAGNLQERPDFLAADDAFYRGKDGDAWVIRNPRKLSLTLLESGRREYNTYCAVCHGETGSGDGIVKEYGFAEIANLTEPRIRQLPDGQIFHTISQGKGLMKSYAHQITPEKRWEVVAYVRVLQRAQTATINDVPEPERTELMNRD